MLQVERAFQAMMLWEDLQRLAAAGKRWWSMYSRTNNLKQSGVRKAGTGQVVFGMQARTDQIWPALPRLPESLSLSCCVAGGLLMRSARQIV
jgi:hypothetical protein